MITISRTEPVVSVDGRRIRLSPSQYRLMVALGSMDTSVIEPNLLMDLIFEHQTRIEQDRQALTVHVSRLRAKVGRPFVKCLKGRGYLITEPVQFR
jgi:DNA-binding response OmpR family regulator